MKIYILLILVITSFNSHALFFTDFVPSPSQMINFYYDVRDDMPPLFSREKRLKEQNIDEIMDGDSINLKVRGKEIFSIFMESEDKTDTGIIFLHTRGENPNESKTIKPLRIDMAENGYHTLSVQMPVLEKNATYYDYVPLLPHSHPRIKAAIDFYKKMNIKNIIFVAHGCGGHMLMSYIDKYGDSDIKAVIGIGMGATDTNQEVIKEYPLATMKIPVLDIIGQYDYRSVKKHFKTRKAHLALSSENNKQVILSKAKHYHHGEKEFKNLTSTIYKFLSKI